ncbi:unnamed protein product [Paramecium sonneborni]|uniref:UvrD-like helicase ATP-binding domain-containing protein n=1 Tax=Paramecium sonneborni TaxID=65129 RepID=A0A8S1R0S6_9CILI|nr:unnamed protein product [Paramecium sonneborni]
MNKNIYHSAKDYIKIKRRLYQEKLCQILTEIEQQYNIKLSGKQFLIRYFQYLRQLNERKIKGDGSIFSCEMIEYFQKLNIENFFPNKIWQFNVAKSFFNCLYNISEIDITHILILLNLILQGKFNQSSSSIIRVLPYQKGNVLFPFQYDYIIDFNNKSCIKLVIQAIPILYPILNIEGKLTHFEFHHEIILVGLVPENKQNSNNINIIDKYLRYQQTSPNFFTNMKLVKEKINDQQMLNEIKIGEKPKFWKDRLIPRQFQPILLNDQDYVYNKNFERWIPISTQIILNRKQERINQFSENHYLIQKYSQQPSSYQLLKIIQNIPNYKVNLTNQQQEIISYNGDGLVIGRSGTGKTTCALLRLFTTDILFKIRSKLEQINKSTDDIQLNQEQQGCKLKTAFITASPLLACQVKRLYDKLVQNIQDVINNKKKQKNKNYEENQVQNLQNDMDQSTFQIINAIQNDSEQQGSQKLNQEEEVNDQELNEYEKEMGKFQRFSDINQFPTFLTLRKFLFLIDGSLINSYFQMFGNNRNKTSEWHNEQCGQMILNYNIQNDEIMQKKLEQLNQRLMDEIDNSDYIQTKMFEVTQDVFIRNFWPKILQTMKQTLVNKKYFDPIYIWSEICTKIKGHETSHEYPGGYINFDNYFHMQGLSKEQCSFIYQAFQKYEELKFQLGYYDLLDIVNHINQELAFGNDIIENVHYLLLDELQDVPRAVLILLDQLTELGLFCCGDNAQNIAKGIGFKFYEVQNCLLSYRNSKKKLNRNLKIFDLNVNFRSHNKILQLANSVIRMIEILFPQKIDKLKKETSNLKGPKPVIIKSDNIKQLLSNLCDFFSNDNKTVEFGCNQVIIVKDQESKTKLPIELQNILCLTIYEAKGLEFDDVILFNFFHDSTTLIKDWDQINNLEAYAEYLKKNDYEKFITIHETEVIASKQQKIDELIEIWQLKMKNHIQDQQMSIDLCQELKQLYVAITRPKKRLIIFDQSLEKRRVIQNIWIKLNAVKIIDLQTQPNDIIFQLKLQNDNKENWKRQGFKMFRMNNYDQAAKCFKFAEEQELEKKSIAYNIVVNNAIVNDSEKFLQAAIIFEEIGLLLRAAQCYFTAKQFQKAQELYEKLGLINEIAESAFFAQNYQKAAKNFEISGEIRRALDCYFLLQDWDNVIIILNNYKQEFSQQERQTFLNQFFPNYLQNLTQKIQDNQIELTQEQEEFNNVENSIQTESFIIQDSIIKESKNQDNSQFNQIIDLNNNESSVEILNNEEKDLSQSFQIENESEQNMDHLSIFDPEDEWLKCDQKTIIQSMSSKISHQSEFSNIVLLNQPPQIQLLKFKNNIFITNNVLQQLIQKLLLFSNEFKNHLDQQKYKAIQLSNRKDDDKEFDHIINFVYDLENIDIDSIYMMLDILEQFKSYKLCIYLCNSFKLASFLGRYLVSLVSIYSPLAKTKSLVNVQMATLGSFRKNLLEQSSISQIAINNILDTINPIFLTFKNDNELNFNNSLGLNCYQELIGLGFWKTFIYQLNFKHSIDLCMSFNNFSDSIQIFKTIQQNRKIELSNEEEFKFMKIQYYQQIKLIKGQQDNILDLINEISDIFKITKNYYIKQNQIMEDTDIDQLIINAKIYQKTMSCIEKLKQIEAIIIIYELLKSKIDYTDEKFIELFQILEYSHNNLIQCQIQENINEALLFCYGFSIPQGEIMSHYSHSIFMHISSKLMKQIINDDQNNQNTQITKNSLMFVDIGYEYISIPFELAIQYIINSFTQQIQLILNNKAEKQMDYYPVNDDSFTLDFQDDQEDTLADLLVFLMLEQSNQKIQDKIKYKKIEYQLKKLHPLQIYFKKRFTQQEYSIINSEPSLIINIIHRMILKSNLRIINTPQYIKNLIREISLNLIIQIKNKKDNLHSNITKAINLLNLTDQLSFAVLILQNQKKDQDKYIPYLKYIEFLECQHFGITEDALGCFLDYSQYVMDRFYLDEQLCHIIRIGLNLLLSILCYSQQKLTILKIYKGYLNNIQNIDDDQNCKIKMGIFQLKNLQFVEEYLIYLFEFYEFCCVKYYQDQIQQFLVIFAINLLNTQQFKIIKSLIEKLKQNEQLKKLLKLQEILVIEIQKNKQEIQKKKNILISLSGYLDEDIIEVEIINTKSEQEQDEWYEKCIQLWNNYQTESDYKIESIKNLIKKWKGFKNDHKITLIEQVRRNLQFLRSLQYFQIGKGGQSLIKECQNLRDLNRHLSKNVQNLNEVLQLSITLQRKLLKARQSITNSLDIHLINSLLNDLVEQMKQMIKGNDVYQKLKQLDMDLMKWEENDNNRIIDEEILNMNRKLVIEKWNNLKAGIKVLRKGEKKQLKTIQEVADES